MMSLRVFIFLFASCTLAVVNAEDAVAEKWRVLYDKMYLEAPFKDAVDRMSLDEAKKSMDELISIARANSENVPQGERDEIMFWSQADKFTPEHCKVEREFNFLSHYSRNMDLINERPNLKVYLNYLNDKLVNYCLRIEKELILDPIKAIDVEDIKLIRSFAHRDNDRAANYSKVAQYLSPLYNLAKPSNVRLSAVIAKETDRLYKSRILSVCNRIKDLPEQSRDAINYIDYKGETGRANPRVADWLRLGTICDRIGMSLPRITYEVKNLKRAQAKKLLEKQQQSALAPTSAARKHKTHKSDTPKVPKKPRKVTKNPTLKGIAEE